MEGSSGRDLDATAIGYVLTLFLPALGAVLYQKRRLRRERGLRG